MDKPPLMLDAVGSKAHEILATYGISHPVGAYIAQPGVFPYIPWSKSQLDMFPAGHILTATLGGDPDIARYAREIDRETGDATDADIVPHLIARHDWGHDDGQVYSDLSNLPGVLQAIRDGGIWDEPWWQLRIAWYWGRPYAPSLAQVQVAVSQFVRDVSLVPEARRIWASQWQGGLIDKNAVYGRFDFTRP